MSMYVRIKRDKLTVFLHVDPTDTTEILRQKLQELLQKPAEDQRLYLLRDGGATQMEEGQSLAELKVENDDELAVAYRTEGDQWEQVHVERFDHGGKEEAQAT